MIASSFAHSVLTLVPLIPNILYVI